MQQPQLQPQPQPQDNTLSYSNWKKMNTNYSQMFVNNSQYNTTYPPQHETSLSQQLLTENASNVQETNIESPENFNQLLQNSNRAKHGTFISNNLTNSYNCANYTLTRPNSITSSLAIRKTKNSESSYM